MDKSSFYIIQNNNELTLFSNDTKIPLYQSYWYMEFGKTCAEIRDNEDKTLFTITKKFQFWKWRMVYLISQNFKDMKLLISQNTRNTVFKIELLSGNFEIKVHYRKKKSIYKNGTKIAEFDESLVKKNGIKLLISETSEIKTIFLLYVSLLIGINDLQSKTVLKNQKQLEKNVEAWF